MQDKELLQETNRKREKRKKCKIKSTMEFKIEGMENDGVVQNGVLGVAF